MTVSGRMGVEEHRNWRQCRLFQIDEWTSLSTQLYVGCGYGFAPN